MDFLSAQDSEARFEGYVDALAMVIGHSDRRVPLKAYCEGLLLPGKRQSHATYRTFCDAVLGFLRDGVPAQWDILRDTVTDNLRVIDPTEFRVAA